MGEVILCKNCKYWIKGKTKCIRIYHNCQIKKDGFGPKPKVDEYWEFKTGPDFGCVYGRAIKDSPTKEVIFKEYNNRVWLNELDSSSTGSIVTFDGKSQWRNDPPETRESWVEIGDCHDKVKIHRCHKDTQETYLKKIEKMRNALDEYIIHLKSTIIETPTPPETPPEALTPKEEPKTRIPGIPVLDSLNDNIKYYINTMDLENPKKMDSNIKSIETLLKVMDLYKIEDNCAEPPIEPTPPITRETHVDLEGPEPPPNRILSYR